MKIAALESSIEQARHALHDHARWMRPARGSLGGLAAILLAHAVTAFPAPPPPGPPPPATRHFLRMASIAHTVAPVYPRDARRHGVEVLVILDVEVGPDGKPTDIFTQPGRHFDSSLAQAAIVAVRQWRFTPAIDMDHKPTDSWVRIPVSFTLQLH